MKTFEEKWTAWIDDQLTGEELTEFEISLPDRAAAEAEKRDALKLRTFLKQQLAVAPAMGNEEFFHHQLRQAIARERAQQPRRSAHILVEHRPTGLGRRWISRHFRDLHVLRDPQRNKTRAVAVSDADPQCPRRSGGEPECDDHRVRIEGR